MRVALAVLLAASVASPRASAEDPPAAAAPTTTPTPTASPEEQYRRGKNLFEYGDFPGTIDALASLAVPGRLQDAKEQLDVHRMLGVCYATTGKQLESAREFSSLLSIDPDFALDPF